MRVALTGLVLLLMVGACGPLGGSGKPPATAATVAIKQSDLPNGMIRCDNSGDFNTYLKKLQAKDPSAYSSAKSQWDAAQKDGATAAQVELYTDSAAHCTSLESNSSLVGSATYKLAANFVFQFKDQASAEKGYTTDSVFGFGASSLKSSQMPVIEGKDTGLGPNSAVLTLAINNQNFYVAVWQNKPFVVILVILNVDAAADKKVALAENSRIY